ncbi:MAG: aldolase, partial [Bryobacteraceae bacterium]
MLRNVMSETSHIVSETHTVGGGHPAAEKRKSPLADASDPLRAFLPLPHHHVLFPLGFPVHIKSNELAVVRLAEESWGRFEPRFRDAPIEVRFLVSDVLLRHRPLPPIFRAQGNLLTIAADAHNFACCDLSAGFGFACVTKGAVMKKEYMRNHFLGAMVYTLLDTRNVVALHAACLVKDGHGVLFAGRSGTGKSSLAYACMRRGWT